MMAPNESRFLAVVFGNLGEANPGALRPDGNKLAYYIEDALEELDDTSTPPESVIDQFLTNLDPEVGEIVKAEIRAVRKDPANAEWLKWLELDPNLPWMKATA